MSTDWLEISEGNAPLVLSIPHTGLTIPAGPSLLLTREIAAWRVRAWGARAHTPCPKNCSTTYQGSDGGP